MVNDQLRIRIIEEARKQFQTLGIKRVTMSDIAKQLGVSKKTLYNAFKDKEELIDSTLEHHINEDITQVESGDVVMSDMAINTTGIKNIDSIQTGELCKEAMIFTKEVISEKGFFISKIFMGGTFNEIVALGKKIFREVKVFKPKSSRKESKESFIICKNLRQAL